MSYEKFKANVMAAKIMEDRTRASAFINHTVQSLIVVHEFLNGAKLVNIICISKSFVQKIRFVHEFLNKRLSLNMFGHGK